MERTLELQIPCTTYVHQRRYFFATIRSVTSSALGGTGTTEEQVANKCAEADGEHDPAVVCHEKKPAHCQRSITVRQDAFYETHMIKNE